MHQLYLPLQQTITWANVDPDLCRHIASLDHNKLNEIDVNSSRI